MVIWGDSETVFETVQEAVWLRARVLRLEKNQGPGGDPGWGTSSLRD